MPVVEIIKYNLNEIHPIQNKKFTGKKKHSPWKSQTKETEVGTSFTPKSTYDIGNFNTFNCKNVINNTKFSKKYNRFQLKSFT